MAPRKQKKKHQAKKKEADPIKDTWEFHVLVQPLVMMFNFFTWCFKWLRDLPSELHDFILMCKLNSSLTTLADKHKHVVQNNFILWRPQASDLELVRLPVKGHHFYVQVKIQSFKFKYGFPHGLATTTPPHVSLAYSVELDYNDRWRFEQQAREILFLASQIQEDESWLHLQPRGNKQKPQFFLPATSYGGVLLQRIQDLLPLPRNPENLHITCRDITLAG
jgi:hypothetical protein